jgi:hypothetical protein
MITVELQQMILLRRIHLAQRTDVLVESLLVDLRVSAVYHLHGLAVVRRSGTGFEDASAKEDLAAKDDYGGVPVKSARVRVVADTGCQAKLV